MENIIEAINREVSELKPCVQRENLTSYCDDLYRQWEELQLCEEENKRLQEENEILKRLLSEKTSYEDKQYIRFKYEIDLGYHYGTI